MEYRLFYEPDSPRPWVFAQLNPDAIIPEIYYRYQETAVAMLREVGAIAPYEGVLCAYDPAAECTGNCVHLCVELNEVIV